MYVKLYSFIFKWFGGRHQAIYSMFPKISAWFNNKVAVSLIHPSGTQMAGYWIAWNLESRVAFEASF